MARWMGLLRLFPMLRKSSEVRHELNSGLGAFSPGFHLNNKFTAEEKVTVYREVPEMELSTLWLQNADPSLLQDPENVAMQVASLTEFAVETLERLRVLEARQQNDSYTGSPAARAYRNIG